MEIEFLMIIFKIKCQKIKSNNWVRLSENIRIKSFADWNQDSSILIEINKDDIIFNLNDGSVLLIQRN